MKAFSFALYVSPCVALLACAAPSVQTQSPALETSGNALASPPPPADPKPLSNVVKVADTRDRSKIPSTRNLAQAERLGTHGNWTIRRNRDAMSDQISCTAVYKQDYSIQLNKETLFITVKQGGVKAYQYRLDDAKASEMVVAGRIEQDISSVMLKNVGSIAKAGRLRVNVLTILSTSADFDIDLKGVREAVAVLGGSQCAP